MKIVIIGSHSTGKTTLAKQIVDHLNHQNQSFLHRTLSKLFNRKGRNEMKIGVTGAHSTGKTTLSMLVSGKLKFTFLPEAPFQAFQAGFPMNETTSEASEVVIFAIQAMMEQRFKDNFVADKCFIDLLAYAAHLFPDNRELLRALERVAKPYIQGYDLVIYLPCGEFPIVDDGYRSLDPEFQRAIDYKIVEIMARLGISYHRVTGSPTERLEKVKKLLTK